MTASKDFPNEVCTMTRRRLLAWTLAFTIALLPAMLLGQEATGVIGGRAANQFAPHYLDYSVQLRDAATGKALAATPLDQDGRFSFPNLDLTRRYLVELVPAKSNSPVCTKGPFRLGPGTLAQKTDVTIECGEAPAILWLLLAGAGTASAVALSTASASR
jgi:hypothetical protein